MATRLKKEALDHLDKDETLQFTVAGHAGIQLTSMKSAIDRNSKSLTTYFAVEKIAASMNKTAIEILEDEVN